MRGRCRVLPRGRWQERAHLGDHLVVSGEHLRKMEGQLISRTPAASARGLGCCSQPIPKLGRKLGSSNPGPPHPRGIPLLILMDRSLTTPTPPHLTPPPWRKESRRGPALLGDEAKRAERFSNPGKPPHPQDTSWDRRRASEAVEGELNRRRMKQAGQSETYTDGLHHNPACPNLGHMSLGRHGGWMLEHGDWRVNLGRILLLKARRQPEGAGVRKFATGNACGGN